jgi:hypothetical protein
MNIFSEIAKGFIWIGKAIADATKWIPRIVTITEDVGQDAEQLIPQATTVLLDVDDLALAAVKDGGAALTSAAALTAAIVAAAESNALNIAEDEAVVTAFEAFIKEVATKSTWSDVITAQQKLVADWDTFGAAAEAALKKLEADASGN